MRWSFSFTGVWQTKQPMCKETAFTLKTGLSTHTDGFRDQEAERRMEWITVNLFMVRYRQHTWKHETWLADPGPSVSSFRGFEIVHGRKSVKWFEQVSEASLLELITLMKISWSLSCVSVCLGFQLRWLVKARSPPWSQPGWPHLWPQPDQGLLKCSALSRSTRWSAF